MEKTSLNLFHPLISGWFLQKFGKAHEIQERGWQSVSESRNTLIAAPTGSGKTLAAFLVCIDRLIRKGIEGRLADETEVLYLSPLKALGNDVRKNLEMPIQEISDFAFKRGILLPDIRVKVRSGDTLPAERRSISRKPPHILVTTPESFYLLLTSESGRNTLKTVGTLIIDEIHAIARDKRGSHLALSAARLESLCQRRILRIGLSATQKPIERIAGFLTGSESDGSDPGAECRIIDSGHARRMDLAVEAPETELGAVCSNEQWEEIYTKIAELIRKHRSTLVFVNTRRLAEKVTFHLSGLLGEAGVASHHGSLAKESRFKIENDLKEGRIRSVVATASLELGIDIGFVDLVIQIGSPRSIAAFLQRIGRSGHSLGLIPKGRLFALTRDELLECGALVRGIRKGTLDEIDVPEAPLDILAQQIVAAAACEEWDEDELFEQFCRAYPYRRLSRKQFDAILEILSEGIAPGVRDGSYLYRDRVHNRVRGKRGARIAALTSGGAIPEIADFKVVSDPDNRIVGGVDEDFALESMAGDIFLLGNTSWRILWVRGGEVRVSDARGAAPTIPFWRGEAPFRTKELSAELSLLRSDLETRLDSPEAAIALLREECGIDSRKGEEAIHYLKCQREATGFIPTQRHLLVERFFDESGGMQIAIHSPYGGRINRAFGLALRKRFCRRFDFELQASADDNSILISAGPGQSFPIEEIREMIPSGSAREILTQALLAAPLFTVRWRWNVSRALVLLRFRNGKKVPPALQRFKADDLLTRLFPALTACPENGNYPGNLSLPEHPLIDQTVYDALHEALDLNGWTALLRRIEEGEVRMTSIDSREPSPFAYSILNGSPYTFLDGAPLEERRARAVSTRRTLSPEALKEIGKLDPESIEGVKREAWPMVRNPDELHEALQNIGILPLEEGEAWHRFFAVLTGSGRATRMTTPGGREFWVPAERWSEARAAYPSAVTEPELELPDRLREACESEDAVCRLVRGRMEYAGPVTASEIAGILDLSPAAIEAALFRLESEGLLLRGHFSGRESGAGEKEWCHRALLARIHRLTLEKLRHQISPVAPEAFVAFLLRRHHLAGTSRPEGAAGLLLVLRQLQGFEIPAKLWESEILPGRTARYQPRWLDELTDTGEFVWGRVREEERKGDASRILPVSLMEEEAVKWLRSGGGEISQDANSRTIADLLERKGALFLRDLVRESGLLPAQVEVSLWKLAASGRVTGDGFEAIRFLVNSARRREAMRRFDGVIPGRKRAGRLGNGRWTVLERGSAGNGDQKELESARLSGWCRLLLCRYGIVFREILRREDASPPWHALLPVFRRMEMKGEIYGGRFVRDVSGEQYAIPDSVEQLREESRRPGPDELVRVNAADPLNLEGIVNGGILVKAVPNNALVYRRGRCIAHQQGENRWIDPAIDPLTAREAEGLLRNRRQGFDRR